METVKSQKITPIGPYSLAVKSSGLVFVSGQISPNGSIKDQTKGTLENLNEILESGGSSMKKVVKTTVYLKDMSDFKEMNEVYKVYFKEGFPARSTVQVVRLPKDALIEIECVAEVD